MPAKGESGSSRGVGWQSVAISGHQWQSAALVWPSDALVWPSDALGWQSAALVWHSAALGWQSVAITSTEFRRL